MNHVSLEIRIVHTIINHNRLSRGMLYFKTVNGRRIITNIFFVSVGADPMP